MTTVRIATYRLQLHAEFPFAAAEETLGYLKLLGISHCYSSPWLEAAPGSKHCYDVTNPEEVNPELGGERGLKSFTDACRENELAVLLDIVPNHMAIGTKENRWWWDVLENGRLSRFSGYFDVDWSPPIVTPVNYDTVLVPILGDHYGRVLEAGELKLSRSEGSLVVTYYDNTFPISPSATAEIFKEAAVLSGSELYLFLAKSLGALPIPEVDDEQGIKERHQQKEVIRLQIQELWERDSHLVSATDRVIRRYNENFDLLDSLLAEQNYRLAYWRVAKQELGYRRFFDVTELAALRVEHEEVFYATHHRVLRWLEKKVLDGTRVDHADGLANPDQYLSRLRSSAPGAWIIVEKILEEDEDLPDSWPVEGTTGYEFLALVNGLFVDPKAEEPLTNFYKETCGESRSFKEVIKEKKKLIITEVLGGDVNRLAHHLREVCEQDRKYRDYTWEELRRFISAFLVNIPVYRTYLQPGLAPIRASDAAIIAQAIERTRQDEPEIDPLLLDFIKEILLLKTSNSKSGEFILRLQQLTGPVTAKSVEDTAFYCYNRLISLNEVGGNPEHFSVSPELFHQNCHRRQQRHPYSLLATSTHDTKRSEDVRLRINVLSEAREEWISLVSRWFERSSRIEAEELPGRNTIYFIYQTIVGTWPITIERLTQYLTKAIREAKMHTSWIAPNEKYEQAVLSFCESLLNDREFIEDLEKFLPDVLYAARIHSLAQTLLKITAPGVPDFYQGTELWTTDLVDPDNRRPVDYQMRQETIRRVGKLTGAEVMREFDSGAPKLFLIQRALATRREHESSLGPSAAYRPLNAVGAKANHLIAFSRGERAFVLVPRLVYRLNNNWGDTTIEIPPGSWRNVFTDSTCSGGKLEIKALLAEFPVALLLKEDGEEA